MKFPFAHINSEYVYFGNHFIAGLLLTLFSSTLNAATLCERLMEKIELMRSRQSQTQQDDRIVDATVLARALIKAIVRSVKLTKENIENRAAYYEKLAIKFNRKGRTLHTYFDDHRNEYSRDTIMVLELPSDYTNTPWSKLTEVERQTLAELMAKFFSYGLYDEEIKAGDMSAYASLFDEKAFSPRLILKAAKSGDFAGVCRQANCALAGLLSEIGVPKQDLRLVIGGTTRADKVVRHIWVEYRTSENSLWLQLDGTGMNLDGPTGEAALLLRVLFDRPSVKRKNLRTIYSQNIKVIDDFLEPKSAKDLGIDLKEIQKEFDALEESGAFEIDIDDIFKQLGE